MCSLRSWVPSVLAFKGQWGSEQGCSGLFPQVIPLKLHETSRNVKKPRSAETYFLMLSNNGINLSKRDSDRRKNQLCSLVMSSQLITQRVYSQWKGTFPFFQNREQHIARCFTEKPFLKGLCKLRVQEQNQSFHPWDWFVLSLGNSNRLFAPCTITYRGNILLPFSCVLTFQSVKGWFLFKSEIRIFIHHNCCIWPRIFLQSLTFQRIFPRSISFQALPHIQQLGQFKLLPPALYGLNFFIMSSTFSFISET